MRSCIKKVVALVLPLLLHSLAVPTLTHEDHNGERWIESDGQILPEPERLSDAEDLRYLEWVRGYGLDDTASVLFSVPCVGCEEEDKQRIEQEVFTVTIDPSAEAGCSNDLNTRVHVGGETLHASELSLSETQRSGSLRQLFSRHPFLAEADWQVNCACVHPTELSPQGTAACNDWAYIFTFDIKSENGQSVAGFSLSYKQSPMPQLLRFSPFVSRPFDNGLIGLRQTTHWQISSPLDSLVPGAYANGVLIEAARQSPSSSPIVGASSTLSLLSVTSTGLINLPTPLNEGTNTFKVIPQPTPTIELSSHEEAPAADSSHYTPKQNPGLIQNVINKLNKLHTLKVKAGEMMFGNTGQARLAAAPVDSAALYFNVSPDTDSSQSESASAAEAPLEPEPQLRNDQAVRAFQLTSVIVVIVALSTLAFAFIRRDPRRRAERAARREERRNRRLYRHAACQHKWRTFFARIRENDLLSRTTSRLFRNQASDGRIDHPATGRFVEVDDGFSDPALREKFAESVEADNNSRISMSMSGELSAFRKAHVFVEGILQAEQGLYFSPTAARKNFSVHLPQNFSSSSQARRHRRYSSSFSEKSSSAPPPPYEEDGEAVDIVVDVDGVAHFATDVRVLAGGVPSASRGRDTTPASSVITTSAPTSDYESSDCEKD